MQAIISTTYDDKYLFFLPIVTWLWNKVEVDVICFLPFHNIMERPKGFYDKDHDKLSLITHTLKEQGLSCDFKSFDAPEHKEATYAQCSRLFAAGLDLSEEELLITSDVDMAVFQIPPHFPDGFTIVGADLTPDTQYPMCYAIGTTKEWKSIMKIGDATHQEMLDYHLKDLEAQHFRGNFWARDQELLFNHCEPHLIGKINRARPGTQFADKRYDRDDSFLLERLSPDTIDFHLLRPGYTDENFDIIMTVLKYHYPQEDFTWLHNYKESYIKLL